MTLYDLGREINQAVKVYQEGRRDRDLDRINRLLLRLGKFYFYNHQNYICTNYSEQSIYDASSELLMRLYNSEIRVIKLYSILSTLDRYYQAQEDRREKVVDEIPQISRESDWNTVSEIIEDCEMMLFEKYNQSDNKLWIDKCLLTDDQRIRFRLATSVLNKYYVDKPQNSHSMTLSSFTRLYIVARLSQFDNRYGKLLSILGTDKLIEVISMLLDSRPLRTPTTEEWQEVISDISEFEISSKNIWARWTTSISSMAKALRKSYDENHKEVIPTALAVFYENSFKNAKIASSLIDPAELTIQQKIEVYKLAVRDLALSSKVMEKFKNISDKK